jgi:hypothetical protein
MARYSLMGLATLLLCKERSHCVTDKGDDNKEANTALPLGGGCLIFINTYNTIINIINIIHVIY